MPQPITNQTAPAATPAPPSPAVVATNSSARAVCSDVASAARGSLLVAQQEVSRVLHAAIHSRNRERASARIQRLFRRGDYSRTARTDAAPTVPSAPSHPSIDRPSENDQTMDIEFVSTRAAIPAIAAASARSLDRIRNAPNANPPSILPETATLEEDFLLLSRLVWGVEELRPMQLRTVKAIYEHEKLVVIDVTGGGKSHNIRLLGSFLGGVHVIFHPILALTADQLTQFQSGSDEYGAIVAINLDEVATTNAVKRKIIAYITRLTKSTSTTVFFFSSPQYMDANPAIMNALLNCCARKGTFRSITIDEAHLWAKQGSSFREEIRFLQHNFFAPLYAGNNDGPLFLAMTATMSLKTLATFSSLTYVGFPPERRVWSSASAFAQTNITMKHHVSNEYTRNLDEVVTVSRETPSAGAFIFVNMKSLSHKLLPKLEDKLQGAVDVIHVHGSLAKEEKLTMIKLLMGTILVSGFHPNVLLATSAADIGINHPNCLMVLIFEWPEDLATYVQRRGRAGRRGQEAVVILVAGISAYSSLMWRIYSSGDHVDEDSDDANNTIAGANTMVTPKKAKRHKQSTRKEYPLTTGQRKKLVGRGIAEFMDVLQVFCLLDGCQHARIQEYLAKGQLGQVPNALSTCGGACPVCSGAWHETFLPVDKHAVILWFNSGTVRDAFPMDPNVDNLFKLLWKVKHWTVAIFDVAVSNVRKSHIEAFFLQMIAAGFIAVQRKSGSMKWVVCREPTNRYSDRLVYENIDRWSNVHTYPEGRTRSNRM